VTAQLARRFPGTRLVKAFNTFGAEFHADPKLGATSADLYLAGDDVEAKRALSDLARTLGFEPVDVGPLRNARHLESLAILWIHLATVGGKGRDVAFKLLHR
jgi:predicted dinucleotide-binding enzyme